MSQPTDSTLAALVEAALPHVAFDGWSPAAFRAAVRDSGVDPGVADAVAPRGAVDLALAFHRQGDARMSEALASADLGEMRYRDKVAHAVRLRIESASDREAVRRGMALFALPPYAALGARALWETADAIWTALGDTSDDVNWYTKRATLSGVYASTVLYWLGDDSPDARDTWAFLDRRIENVMQIEKVKSRLKAAPVLGPVLDLQARVLSRITRPAPRSDVPGT